MTSDSSDISNRQRPLFGLTMGDPAGIGAEIITKSLARDSIQELCRPLVIGDFQVMVSASQQITKLNLDVRRAGTGQIPQNDSFRPGCLNVLDLANVDSSRLEHGRISAGCGRAAYEYIETAIRLAMEEKISGRNYRL